MKHLLFLSAFFTTQLYAADLCQTYLDGKNLSDFTVISEKDVDSFPDHFYELSSLHSFVDRPERCLPLRQTEFVLPTGVTLTAYGTQNDSCDGGNTYGVVTNKKNQAVAVIADYDMYCELKKLEIKVEQVVCGEIDPYEVGDACLVLGKVGYEKWGLVFDFDRFLDKFGDEQGGTGEERLKKGPVIVNKKFLEVITKKEKLEELRPFGPKHTFYQAELESIKVQ